MALTIRLTPEQEKLVEKLKQKIGESRASQALLTSAKYYVEDRSKMYDRIIELQEEVRSYKQELGMLKSNVRDLFKLNDSIRKQCNQ